MLIAAAIFKIKCCLMLCLEDKVMINENIAKFFGFACITEMLVSAPPELTASTACSSTLQNDIVNWSYPPILTRFMRRDDGLRDPTYPAYPDPPRPGKLWCLCRDFFYRFAASDSRAFLFWIPHYLTRFNVVLNSSTHELNKAKRHGCFVLAISAVNCVKARSSVAVRWPNILMGGGALPTAIAFVESISVLCSRSFPQLVCTAVMQRSRQCDSFVCSLAGMHHTRSFDRFSLHNPTISFFNNTGDF